MKTRIIICALIIIIFAVVAFAQPNEIGVDLSVVSVDSGSGEVCFKAIVTSTGPLPTPPEFAYDYDWENDATYDLTDAGDSVCHTYTPGDSLWAKVKATTATYEAEDSAEVVVPQTEEYSFDTVLTQEIWEGVDFTPSDWIFDDDGTPWILGDSEGDEGWFYKLVSDTAGNIDTIYAEQFPDTVFVEEPYSPYNIIDAFLITRFEQWIWDDTFINVKQDTIVDTIISGRYYFDSLTVKPIPGDYSSWKFTEDYLWPILNSFDGWSLAQLDENSPVAESLYSGYNHIIAQNGLITTPLDLPDNYTTIKQSGNYFAVLVEDENETWTISVYNKNGLFLYSEITTWSDFPNSNDAWEIISNGSLVFADSSAGKGEITIHHYPGDEVYSYEICDTSINRIRFAEDTINLFLLSYPSGFTGTKLYYFSIEDSIDIKWQVDVPSGADLPGLIDSGTPFFLRSWGIYILSRENGEVISIWPEVDIGKPWLQIKDNYLFLSYLDDNNPSLDSYLLLKINEGGE